MRCGALLACPGPDDEIANERRFSIAAAPVQCGSERELPWASTVVESIAASVDASEAYSR
jgi:hypothetical protein